MSMAKIQANYLFVYGYLMQKNRSVEELGVPEMPVEYIGEGYMFGNLYRVAGFPGLVYDNTRKKRVYGEIYLIREKHHFFREMDEYELSFPNYHKSDAVYHRRIRPAYHTTGRVFPCWVYEYIKPTKDLMKIRSGRFILTS